MKISSAREGDPIFDRGSIRIGDQSLEILHSSSEAVKILDKPGDVLVAHGEPSSQHRTTNLGHDARRLW